MKMRDVIIFAAGVAIGAAGSYFVLKKQYIKDLDNEVKETKEYARARIAEYNQRAEIAEMALEKLEAMEVEVPTDEPEKTEDGNYSDRASVYDHTSTEYPGDGEFPPDGERELIYLITEKQYDETKPLNTKTELYYYELDDTMVTDQNELVDCVRNYIGDCKDEMDAAGPWKTFWVRNDRTDTDYIVYKYLGAWSDSN